MIIYIELFFIIQILDVMDTSMKYQLIFLDYGLPIQLQPNSSISRLSN